MDSDGLVRVADFVEFSRHLTEEEREVVIHLIRGAGIGRKIADVKRHLAETTAEHPNTEKR